MKAFKLVLGIIFCFIMLIFCFDSIFYILDAGEDMVFEKSELINIGIRGLIAFIPLIPMLIWVSSLKDEENEKKGVF